MLDDHGQPLDTRWNAARRADRTIHELLGLVKGIIADGVVCEHEAELLLRWTVANPEASRMWPGDVIADRLSHIFHDGVADEEERADLKYILEKVTGGGYFAPDANPSTRLPLDEPAPE